MRNQYLITVSLFLFVAYRTTPFGAIWNLIFMGRETTTIDINCYLLLLYTAFSAAKLTLTSIERALSLGIILIAMSIFRPAFRI